MVYNIVPKFYFHFLFFIQPVSVSPNHPQVTLQRKKFTYVILSNKHTILYGEIMIV